MAIVLKSSIFALLFMVLFWEAESLSNEQQIYNSIFSGYSTELRPVLNSSEAVTINLKFELTKIREIDEVKQIMYVVGFMIAEWTDQYLRWNASDYGGIDRLVVPASKLWLPDFALVNSADTFYHSEFVDDFRVLLLNTGNVRWSFGGNLAVSCELELTYYPFDQQLCFLQMENWQYDKTEVVLLNSTSEIEQDEFHRNGLWTVTKTTSHGGDITHEAFPGQAFPVVRFEIFLMRKPGYVGVNILLPCLLLATLALMGFWLPVDSGEKVGLGITIILAFGVFALLVSQNTPATSDSYPLLTVWMCVLIFVTSIDTVISIAALYCHFHSPSPMPRLPKILFFKYIARIVCMTNQVPAMDKEEEVIEIKNDNMSVSSIVKEPVNGEDVSGEASGQKGFSEQMHQVVQHLGIITRYIKEKEEEASVMDEWMALARVLDRFMFWVNFFIIVISSLFCFLLRGAEPVPEGYD